MNPHLRYKYIKYDKVEEEAWKRKDEVYNTKDISRHEKHYLINDKIVNEVAKPWKLYPIK